MQRGDKEILIWVVLAIIAMGGLFALCSGHLALGASALIGGGAGLAILARGSRPARAKAAIAGSTKVAAVKKPAGKKKRRRAA